MISKSETVNQSMLSESMASIDINEANDMYESNSDAKSDESDTRVEKVQKNERPNPMHTPKNVPLTLLEEEEDDEEDEGEVIQQEI